MLDLINSIKSHADSINKKAKPCKCSAYDFPHKVNSGKCGQRAKSCNCPIESDPFGTGDTGYRERNCQNPFNCACE